MWKLDNLDKIMAEQKEKQNDLSIKNSRLWQKEQIRLQHDMLMQEQRRDTTLEVCEDPSGRVSRENIIPFALSQGGNYSRHNLYVEVTDTIKINGYLHEGMLQLLDSLVVFKERPDAKEKTKETISTFFNAISLCGPRIVDEPGAKDKKKLCELFVPYQHSMTQFYNLIESMYVVQNQKTSSFVETMERSLHKRAKVKRLGKANANDMQQIMQAKPAANMVKGKHCKHTIAGTTWTSDNLAKMKQMYCNGYNHLDLSSKDIKNIAVHYLEDLPQSDAPKQMLSLSKQIRYQVTDIACQAAPLFEAKDISIQPVAMDALGKGEQWAAVANLNTQDANGYLQSELPRCNINKYLIGTEVEVKVYEDNENCCEGVRDYEECKKLGCELSEVKNVNEKHYSKKVTMTGTSYKVDNLHLTKTRRRLLTRSDGDC
eukprot:g7895.t1